MAATFVNFAPSTTSVFTFQAQLAGVQYTVSVKWNVFGQRYYVVVSDLSGNVLINRPLIACGPQFTVLLTWADGVATAATVGAHNVPVGSVANAWVSRTGSGFDGGYQVLATTPTILIYPLASNPNTASPATGALGFNLNLVESIIAGGYLLFRYETQQFEFGP